MSKLTKEQAFQFAGFLLRQAGPGGRANLAELRRAAANPNQDFRDLAILSTLLADDTWVFDAQRLTAGLFALYAPRFWDKNNQLRLPPFSAEARRRSFGASLRRFRFQLSGGQEGLDQRFNALLDTPREDLAVPLRGLLQRLATADQPVPVDFGQLLLDLVYWEYDYPDRRSVRRDWARDYWQGSASSPEETADQPVNTIAELN